MLNKFPDEWIFEKIILFLILFLSYSIKFLDILYFDIVLVTYISFALYALSKFQYFFKKDFFLDNEFPLLIFFLFILSSFCFSLINYLLFSADISHVKYILISLLFLPLLSKYNVKQTRVANFFIFLFSTPIFIVFGYLMVMKTHFAEFLGVGFRDNYLILSDLMAIFGLLFLSYSRIYLLIRLTLFCFIFLGVLLLGSRSSILFLLLSFFIFFLFEYFYFEKLEKVFSLFMVISFIFLFIIFLIENTDFFYRFFSIISILDDHSTNERSLMMKIFWEKLIDSPIVFVVGGGVELEGTFSHNIFSIWQLLGLPSFIFFIFFIMLSFFKICKNPFFYRTILPLWIYCGFSLIFSRGVVSIVFPMILILSILLICNKRIFFK